MGLLFGLSVKIKCIRYHTAASMCPSPNPHFHAHTKRAEAAASAHSLASGKREGTVWDSRRWVEAVSVSSSSSPDAGSSLLRLFNVLTKL